MAADAHRLRPLDLRGELPRQDGRVRPRAAQFGEVFRRRLLGMMAYDHAGEGFLDAQCERLAGFGEPHDPHKLTLRREALGDGFRAFSLRADHDDHPLGGWRDLRFGRIASRYSYVPFT